MWDVVLRLTGRGACLAANTFIQINHHSPSWHVTPLQFRHRTSDTRLFT
jgi:hypothetical protein